MIPAIILAGGASSRMGRAKALLPLPGGETFLSRIVSTLRTAGVDEIVVVVGCHVAIIRSAVAESGLAVRTVENPDPARGQLSSLLVGIDALPRPVSAVLVTPVDLPLVSVATVRKVLDAWLASRPPIVRPERAGRHGHPVIFDARIMGELRTADLAVGARAVVQAHRDEILDVAVDDDGAFDDIDTPEEYEAALQSLRARGR